MFGEIYISQLTNSSSLEELLGRCLIYIVYSTEVTFILFSLILLFGIFYLSQHKDVFHTNLNICLYYYCIMDIVMAFIRLMILCKEFMGTVVHCGGVTYFSFRFPVTPIWQMIFCETRVIFIVTTWTAMPVILLERTCATFYLGKYNKKQRLHIPLFCLLLPNALLFCSYSYWVDINNILWSGIVALSVTIIALFSYIVLVYYNGLRLQRMYNGCSSYSLSNRYQIDENGRVFRIIRNFFFVISIHLCLIPTTIISAFSIEDPQLKGVLQLLGEFLLSTIPIPTILCFIFSIKEWRHELFSFFCGSEYAKKTAPIQPVQGDAYFNHLSKLWNTNVAPDVESNDLS